jgi:hypothetical protein
LVVPIGAVVEFNRNHYLVFGLVLLLVGIQLRLTESFVLNEKTSRFLAERLRSSSPGDGLVAPMLAIGGPVPRRVVQPPQWLGWAIISVGSVLILHSLALKKPGG